MGLRHILLLVRGLLLSGVLATVLGACAQATTPLPSDPSIDSPLAKPTFAQVGGPVAPATLQNERDDRRALSAIEQIVGQPAGKVSFVERTVMINSPNADVYVLIYEDQDGARYSVDEAQYVFVQFQPSGLRFAPAAPLSAEELRESALKLASASDGFVELHDRLRYEEGLKGDNHFFTWTDTMPGWKYNPPTLQIALGEDGTLVNYIDTLLYAP